jgi:hypothetical protein
MLHYLSHELKLVQAKYLSAREQVRRAAEGKVIHTHTHTHLHTHTHTHIYIYIYIYIKVSDDRLIRALSVLHRQQQRDALEDPMVNFYNGGGADHALVPLVPSSDGLLDQPKIVTNSPTIVGAPSSHARLYQHGGGSSGGGEGGEGRAPPMCADALVPQSQNTFCYRTYSTTEHTTPPAQMLPAIPADIATKFVGDFAQPAQTLPASPADIALAGRAEMPDEPVGAGTGTHSRKYVIH